MSENDAQVIVDTATRATKPDPLDGAVSLHSVVIPAGAQHVLIDTEKLLAPYSDNPRRKKGHVSLTTPASLTQYVIAHKGDGTEIYADWRRRQAVAILNDHDAARAGWGDHRATLTLVATPEWSRWTDADGQWMTQGDFAEHIIDTTADIVDPPAADLLEMAETFTATQQVSFKSGHRLQNGQRQLTYVETVDAQAGTAGNVVIPESVVLCLAPFDGADAVEISARIRYRINGGNLRIGYVLDRPDLVLRDAFSLVMAGIEKATGITALWGTPRS